MGLQVTRWQHERLSRIVREQRGEARLYRRARMVVLAAAGGSVASIARQMGTCRARVGDWLSRFASEGIDGLADEPRSGRPVVITPLERHQIIAAACQAPSALGVERKTWTHESLRTAVIAAGLVHQISASEVGRILEGAALKPHRVRGWCHSTDPDYQRKMRSIVRLYVAPTAREPVLCVDEKTGMQALSRSRDLQPPAPGRPGRQEFEYRRNGTRCLFACFNVGTGKVLGHCTRSRTRADFLSFLDLVASIYRQHQVHVVLDNLNTHRDTGAGAFISDWNRRHGERFVFHYTPTHGSWLNQVELWFAIVARRVLRHANFATCDDLVAAIDRFIERWNTAEAHPFRWTYQGLPLVR